MKKATRKPRAASTDRQSLPSPQAGEARLAARDDARAGARLTEAIVEVAAQHARQKGVPDMVVVGALVSALGSVAAAVARTNGYDLSRYEEIVAAHFARVFQAESVLPVYH